MHESFSGFAWLKTVLWSDTQIKSLVPGGVRRGYAPFNTPTPYIILALQSGADVLTANAFRLMASLVYQIQVVGPASNTEALVQAANRIDELLKRRTGTNNGSRITCFRESSLSYDELVEGEMWTHIGGLYRLQITE